MKWFWICLFAFLTIIIVGVNATHPDVTTDALNWIGILFFWFLTGLGAILLLIVVVLGVIVINRQIMKNRRMVDGAFPLQVKRVGGLFGIGGDTVITNPNLFTGFAYRVKRDGKIKEHEPVYGWQSQNEYAGIVQRVNAIRAAFPGDAARADKHGKASKMPSATAGMARLLHGGGKENRTPPPMLVDGNASPIYNSAASAIDAAAPLQIPLGTDNYGSVVPWQMERDVHLRVHGSTQVSGKTNLIKTIAAGAIWQGAHVLVLDRRRFKDWHEFDGRVEKLDTRSPENFANAMHQIEGIYRDRDKELAMNPGRHYGPDERVIVIISEFGTLHSIANASGEFRDIEPTFLAIMSEAGGTGVHMILEDQVPEGWPRSAIVNAIPMTGQVPMNYGSTVGMHKAHELRQHQFHLAGATFDTWDMRAELPAILEKAPVLNGYRVMGRSSHGEGGVRPFPRSTNRTRTPFVPLANSRSLPRS